MTPSPFNSDEAEESSGTRPNFIGKVVNSEPDSDDDTFDTEYESDIDVVYEIEVLDKDWDNVMELGLDISGSRNSKFTVFTGHLENVFGAETVRSWEGPQDMAEFLEGRVLEFTDFDFTSDEEFVFEHRAEGDDTIVPSEMFGDLENPPNNMLMPVREVTDEDELADLGAESEGSVEEVSLE